MRLCVLSLAIFVAITYATVSTGSLKTKGAPSWHYLGKFCFSNYDPTTGQNRAAGTFEYVITTSSKTMYMLLYLGTSNYTFGNGAWDPAYEGSKKGWTCDQLLAAHRDPGIRIITSGEKAAFFPTQSTRAYFWYFAVADCANNGTNGLDLQYSLTMLNPGNFWWRQFSYDEQGVPQMYLTFTLFYIILAAFQAQSVYTYYRTDSLHPLVKILSATVGVHLFSTLSEMIHYLNFGSNGVGLPAFKGFGDLTAMIAQVMMMFLCILVSHGWTITTNYLTDRLAILITTALYFIAHLSLFIWDYVGRDPADTLYFYDSWPGLVVIALRLGLAGWFLYSLSKTVNLESVTEKRQFYLYFGGSYTLWFLLLPAIVAFALVLEPWFRFRTVTGMMLTADALGMFWFVILLSSSRASKYFNIKITPQLLVEQEKLVTPGYGSTNRTVATDYTDDL